MIHADEMIANLGKKKVSESASFFRRLLAFIADILILDLVVFSAFSNMILKNFSLGTYSLKQGLTPELSSVLFLIGIFSFVYFTLLEYGIGKTLGMMMLNIKTEGAPGFWKCTLRNLFLIPLFPITVLWILEPVYLIFRKKRFSEEITKTDTVLD